MIALTLSTIVVILVTSVFMVQNRFYGEAVARTDLQEAVRAATELVTTDVRAATLGSVLVATESRMVLRVPAHMGVFCSISGTNADVHIVDSGAGLDTTGIVGYAVRDTVGDWQYYARAWDVLHVSSGATPAQACFNQGADTVDATDEFHRLDGPATLPSPLPEGGWPVMLYREIEFEIGTSSLDSGELAIYRGDYGETLTEFATGLTADSRFLYRQGSDSYSAPVTDPGELAAIDGIRLQIGAETEAVTAGEEAMEFSWTVDIPLRNAR